MSRSGSGSGSSPPVAEELLAGVFSRGRSGRPFAALALPYSAQVGVSYRQHDLCSRGPWYRRQRDQGRGARWRHQANVHLYPSHVKGT